MFNLDQAIKQYLNSMRKNRGLEDGYIKELHSHLLDDIDHLRLSGKNEREAFETAVANLGPIEKISEDYFKTNSRQLITAPTGDKKGHFYFLYNNIKLAVRRIKKHKGYSLINILGLAIAMASTIFILKWAQNELSYDRFHHNADHLYAATFSNGSISTPTALGPYLKQEYPEIIRSTRLCYHGSNLIKYKNQEINEPGGIMVDPEFAEMFTLKFLKGNKKTSLRDPSSILLSKRLAVKYFGEVNPINKTITFDTRYDLKVTGVFEDYPSNSHLQFEYIIPIAAGRNWNWHRDLNFWNTNYLQTYVQLDKNVSHISLNKKISKVVSDKVQREQRSLSLQPVTQIYLNPMGARIKPINNFYIFSSMGLFILFIACINFMNLTTARSSTLAKEVGVRKVVGAKRSHLIRQFFIESFMIIIFALITSLILILIFLPTFNRITQEAFTYTSMFKGNMILGILGILILTGFFAGSYPSLYLSHFKAAKVLKGTITLGLKGARFRKALVVTQFFLSILLILSTLMIFKQINFLKDQDVGYNKENIVYFRITSELRNNTETLKTQILANPNILSVTMTDVAPYRWFTNAGFGSVNWEGKLNQKVKMVLVTVDTDYLKTFGMEITHGRFFSNEIKSDSLNGYVVNQTAVNAMQMKNPIGKELQISNHRGRIIGVVKDYHFESLHKPIIPMAMRIRPNNIRQACIRIRPQNTAATLQFVEKVYKKISPKYPFEYEFLDNRLQNLYQSEEVVGNLAKVFSILAVFISCLGLFGLSAFLTEKRSKEIGIRKACGASISGLIVLLSREFLKLVLLACIIAVPISIYLMNVWLQKFAYRASMDLGIIALATLLSLGIAFFTVGYHTVKSARGNTVTALRYE